MPLEFIDNKGAKELDTLFGENAIRIWRDGDPISRVSLGSALGLDFGWFSGYKHAEKNIKLEMKDSNWSMGNHAMTHMIEAVLSPDSTKFDESHKGLMTKTKEKITGIASRVKGWFGLGK